jgi:hypothetical protein
MPSSHFVVLIVQVIILSILWILIAVKRVPFSAGPASGTGLPDNQLLMSKNDKITNSGMSIDDSRAASANVIWSSEKITNMIKTLQPAAPAAPAGISQADVLKLISNAQQPKVYFDVSRDNSMKVPGIITYAATLASSGGTAMNTATGTFTCPTKGLYRLTLTALRYYFVDTATPTRILMKRNGVQIATTASTSEIRAIDLSPKPPGGECLSINILVQLAVGDKIYCEIEVGGIYDTADHHVTHFTGELMIEK